MKKLNKKGFTIVELVIVISVIAILSAVMIPTFTSAVRNAKESAALQDATNEYTEYLSDFDYTTGEPAKDFIYIAENGKIVAINDGKVINTIQEDELTAVNAVLELETPIAEDDLVNYIDLNATGLIEVKYTAPEAEEGEGA